ncbi:hypothetical protein [Geodermatophilus sp. SYSU D00696]
MAEQQDRRDLVDQIGGDVLAAGVGLFLPIPGVGVLTERVVRRVREETERRRSVALTAAERVSGMTREEIGERIGDNSQLLSLVTRVLHAAGMNGHDGTLRAMGAALGHAAADPGTADEAEVVLTALADLTEHHARILLLLTRQPPRMSGTSLIWTSELVREESDLAPRLTMLCLSALAARGLAETESGLEIFVHRITPLGRDVLAVLEEYAAD